MSHLKSSPIESHSTESFSKSSKQRYEKGHARRMIGRARVGGGGLEDRRVDCRELLG